VRPALIQPVGLILDTKDRQAPRVVLSLGHLSLASLRAR
jgi:hypothetical protein